MKVSILGGAGYVGSMLVPYLMKKGHDVTVLDTFWFGDHLPRGAKKIKGDIRARRDVRRAINGADAVIHLACVSNDPSFDMNPHFGKTINYDCFRDCLSLLNEQGINRFIYASSSSVYGISDERNVTEDTIKKPLTDYSKFKLACEMELQALGMGGVWTILRPATVCGFSRRLRLDLVVNILTIQALVNKKITLFGTEQKRPNINIKDMVLAYDFILNADERSIDQQIFNVGFENMTLLEIAELVKYVLRGNDIGIEVREANDPRSYHINSDRIKSIGFVPDHSVAQAIFSICTEISRLKDPMTNPMYRNIARMKELGL